MKILWVLAVLCLAHADAQNVGPNPDNLSFDPDTPDEDETIVCTIPPYADTENSFQPEEGMCQAQSTPLTIEDAQALAVAYAPHLFFHPLEEYTLTDVNDFLVPEEGTLYRKSPLVTIDEEINQTAMLLSTRDYLLTMKSDKYFISQDVGEGDGIDVDALYLHNFSNPPGALGGSGYNENGKTNAPIYYRVFDSGNGTWTFNYWFFYAFNGHSNLGVLSSINGTEDYTPFMLRPFGQHEGDWEAISVQVCQSTTPSQPLALSYRQHGWNQITNCLEGECTFYKDTFQPVGFVALNSHATYPVSTRNMVYSNVEVPFIVNLQGVLVVDRTVFRDADGSYKEFAPNATNVLRYQDMDEIELGVTDESLYWQGFGGRWGDITKPSVPPQEPECLANDQLSEVECPAPDENGVFDLVMIFLGVREPSGDDSFIFQLAGAGGSALSGQTGTGEAPGGPPQKSYWKKWSGVSNAPLWSAIASNTTAEDYCARLQEIPDTSRTPVELSSFDMYGNIIGILAFIVVLWLGTLIFYLVPRVTGRKLIPLVRYDDEGEVLKPDRHSWIKLYHSTLLFTLFYGIALAGLIMFANGYIKLLDLMNDLIGGSTWDFIITLVDTLGIFVLVVDTMLFLLMWIASTVLWRQALIAYYDMIGDDENLEKQKKKFFARHFGRYHTTFLVFFSLLFLSLMITTLVVIIGVGIMGFSYAFTEACNETVGSIGDLCLDVGILGIEGVACGPDFQEFCRDWGKTSRATVLWGVFILMAAHFFFIGAAGESYQSQITLYPALKDMPSREEYKSKLLKSSSNDKEPEPQESAIQDDSEDTALDTGVVLAAPEKSRVIQVDDDSAEA